MSLLEIRELSFAYKKDPVLKNISFSVEEGQFIGLLGPNGGGKTTLLRAIGALVPVKTGQVLISNKDVSAIKRIEIARLVSYVPQLSSPVPGFSVGETVLMGRTAYLKALSQPSKQDIMAVEQAIERTGLLPVKDREVSSLSGGQYQRVLIARALAQETPLLLLDEPTAHLDIRFQSEVLALVKSLKEKTVMASFHDISLAKKYCGRVLLLDRGSVVADGEPLKTLSGQTIRSVFSVEP